MRSVNTSAFARDGTASGELFIHASELKKWKWKSKTEMTNKDEKSSVSSSNVDSAQTAVRRLGLDEIIPIPNAKIWY